MSDNPKQGRWDHLLREIPNQVTIAKTPKSSRDTESQSSLFSLEPNEVDFKKSVKKTEKSKSENIIIENELNTETQVKETQDQIYSVSDINRQIKGQLEGQFSHLWIQGEISNFKAHTSGHFYFSLKDDKSQISAVMFKGFNGRLKFTPESGMEVLVKGKISVFEPRGNYQVFCEHMEPVGAGALQKAFEQLKVKLEKEGLFSQSSKKTLPTYPKKVGVVTSPTGAAIQDILNVLGRRSKRVEVVVIPARVQGEGAALEIVRGIELANKIKSFDVLIVGRGGGSIEDLWCFNEEIVARAIFASKIPIISAVGHEIDFTISDFVADLRAPTPSAAAELVTKSELELIEKIKFLNRSLRIGFYQKISQHKKHLAQITKSLRDPRKHVIDSMLRLEDLNHRLGRSALRHIEKLKLHVRLKQQALKRPDVVIEKKKMRVQNLEKILTMSVQKKLESFQNTLIKSSRLLDSLSPLRVLDRGYAIVRSEKTLVPSIEIKIGREIEVELKDGYLLADVTKIIKKEKS